MRRLMLPVVLAGVLLASVPAGASAAASGTLADTCGTTLSLLRSACYSGDVALRDVSAVATPTRFASAISAYQSSWTHRALGLQSALADDVGLRNAPWVGTHNSFNSIAEEGPTLSTLDSNQQLSLVDQLRIDVRSIELDLHYFPSLSTGLNRTPVVCHADGDVGCSVERPLGPILDEVAGWLHDNPGQVLLLYLEDQLGTQAAHDEAAAIIRDRLGSLVYAPPATASCTPLPLDLTRAQVRAAGAQVVIVSGCGEGSAWHGVAFNWSARHVETRPVGYDPVTCGPDFTRATYDSTLVRYFEDSTGLTALASALGQSTEDDGITPQTAAAMASCGVDLTGMDQLTPDDGRLTALVWSWATNEPAATGDCAVQGAGARWSAQPCTGALRPAACRDTATGGWSVSATATPEPGVRCPAGTVFAAPRTGWENRQLAEAAGGRAVWLGFERSGDGWRALDTR